MSTSRFAVATHIVTAVAYNAGRLVTSECLAKSVNTNPVVVRRTLALLSEAGIIASVSGPAGGSRLARDARKISLRDIYEAVESGELFALHPQPPDERCPVGAHIQAALSPVFKKSAAALKSSMAQTSVADIVKIVRRADKVSPCKQS